MRRLHLLFCVTICILFFSCFNEVEYIPDVSQIQPQYKFIDFDSKFFKLEKDNIANDILELKEEHPAFTDLFFSSILPVLKDDQVDNALVSEFISDSSIIHLKDTIDLIIDKKEINKNFTQAFSFAKHYFPFWKTPNIYTLISGFGYQRFLFEDEEGEAIGVGLDFFLGSAYPYKNIDPNNPSFSSYQTRSFDQDHLVKKALEIWIDDKLAPLQGSSMLDHMLRNGKKLYVLDRLLPNRSDTIVMEYSKQQWKWANDNQLQIWTYLINEDLFYETNMRKINKYINSSPDAPGMPAEAAGRIANFMGWQIVKAYMEKNPNVSLESLVMDSNAQAILDKSKYKPRKP